MPRTNPDFHWLIGLAEGEASFDIHRSKWRDKRYENPRIQIRMTDEDVVQRAASVIKALGIPCNVYGPYEYRGHKPQWTVSVTIGKFAYALMVMMYPLMGARRQERILECMKAY